MRKKALAKKLRITDTKEEKRTKLSLSFFSFSLFFGFEAEMTENLSSKMKKVERDLLVF